MLWRVRPMQQRLPGGANSSFQARAAPPRVIEKDRAAGMQLRCHFALLLPQTAAVAYECRAIAGG